MLEQARWRDRAKSLEDQHGEREWKLKISGNRDPVITRTEVRDLKRKLSDGHKENYT